MCLLASSIYSVSGQPFGTIEDNPEKVVAPRAIVLGKNQINSFTRAGKTLVENVSFSSSAAVVVASPSSSAVSTVGARPLSPKADSVKPKQITSNLNRVGGSDSSKQVAKVILYID